MADALWIDENYLLDNSVIYENTDFKVITPNIIYVQHAYIKPLLGTDLYDQIETAINAQTYTALETTLLDKLKLAIMNYVIAESASDMVYKWMNKGIVVKTGENSQTISPQQLEFIQDKYKNRAQIFAQRVTDYLIRYSSSYPNYLLNTDYDDVKAKNNSYETGIFLQDDDFEELRQIRFGNY